MLFLVAAFIDPFSELYDSSPINSRNFLKVHKSDDQILHICSHQVRVDLCQLTKAGDTDRYYLKVYVLPPIPESTTKHLAGQKLMLTPVKIFKHHHRLVNLH